MLSTFRWYPLSPIKCIGTHITVGGTTGCFVKRQGRKQVPETKGRLILIGLQGCWRRYYPIYNRNSVFFLGWGGNLRCVDYQAIPLPLDVIFRRLFGDIQAIKLQLPGDLFFSFEYHQRNLGVGRHRLLRERFLTKASSPTRISQIGLPTSGQQTLCSGILRVPRCGSKAKEITSQSSGSHTSLSKADMIWVIL